MRKNLQYFASAAALGLVTLGGAAQVAAAPVVLTFSEYPVGTVITNQYAAQGVVFSPGINGNYPIIADDGAMPTTPVLSPNPPYAGDFDIEFLTSTTWVQFDSGFWDTIGTGIIDVYDLGGILIDTVSNSVTGVETFTFSNPLTGIGRIVFNSSGDPAGADIGDLSFNVPEPGSLLLLGIGLLGALGLRGKRA